MLVRRFDGVDRLLSVSRSQIGERASAVGCRNDLKVTSGEDIMAIIGFIGLGNMGLPMAQNLVKAGHTVKGFDIQPSAVEKLAAAGAKAATSIAHACDGADVVVTMLPAGEQVRTSYLDGGGVIA